MNDYSHTKKPRKKRSAIWKVSDEELKKVAVRSETISDILNYFGLSNKGGNYKTLYARLEHSNIDISHIPRGTGSNKNRPRGGYTAKSLEEVMVKNSNYSGGKLKTRLIKTNLIENKCQICGLEKEWLGKPITLVMDHINGISNDHRLENLRMLCPNCNSQTATFAGRNIKNKK